MPGQLTQPLSATLSANGTADGTITLTSSSGWPVGLVVWINGTSLPALNLKITANNTTSGVITLGFLDGHIKGAADFTHPDLSSYTTAASSTVTAHPQFVYSQNYAETNNN